MEATDDEIHLLVTSFAVEHVGRARNLARLERVEWKKVAVTPITLALRPSFRVSRMGARRSRVAAGAAMK